MFFDFPPPPPPSLQIAQIDMSRKNINYFLSFIKIPTTKPPEKFSELPCSKEEEEKIIRLISIIGNHGKIDLLLKYKEECRKIEAEIRHIHPLIFLRVIFSHPGMTLYMKNIYKDYFIRKNFIDGLAENMENEKKKNRLYLFLEDFAKEIHASEDILRDYLEKQNYRGFLYYLIYR